MKVAILVMIGTVVVAVTVVAVTVVAVNSQPEFTPHLM
jgi:hypothetical protein